MDLFLREAVARIGEDDVLSKISGLMDWRAFEPILERALKVRLDFMLFCGLNLHASVPDETTYCRFRNALVAGGVYDDLLAQVCRQIEDHGLKLKEADAAIIDATPIESVARPRSLIEPPQDRSEGDQLNDPDV